MEHPGLLPGLSQQGAETARLVPQGDAKTHLSPLPSPLLSRSWQGLADHKVQKTSAGTGNII